MDAKLGRANQKEVAKVNPSITIYFAYAYLWTPLHMPPAARVSKVWCFTINNPMDDQLPKTWPGVSYCVWQLEKGDLGTPHLQGTIKFEKNKKLSALKKIDAAAHWTATRNVNASIDYCQKEDTRLAGPWTLGIAPAQGKRNDLESVKLLIDGGAPMKDVYGAHFAESARYYKFFKEYKRVITPPRTWKTEVQVLIGPTGTGKSAYCAEKYPDAYWLPQGKWFCDYDNQDVVIIDEFYGWLPYSYMLRLLDRYPLLVETKGGSVQFIAKKIVITSNQDPREWYDRLKCSLPPLIRRIDECLIKNTLDGDWQAVDLAQPPIQVT